MSVVARVLAGLAVAAIGVAVIVVSMPGATMGSVHKSGAAVFGLFFGVAAMAAGVGVALGIDGKRR